MNFVKILGNSGENVIESGNSSEIPVKCNGIPWGGAFWNFPTLKNMFWTLEKDHSIPPVSAG